MSLIGSIAAKNVGDRLVYGVIALDGSNPTDVVVERQDPGERIKGAFVGLTASATPGDGASVITWTYTGLTLSIYAWQNTAGTDPTLVASTSTTNVEYFVIVGR